MISKAAGLYQVRSKILHKVKLPILILALMLNSTALQAETYTCKFDDPIPKQWYNISFLEMDTTRMTARFGTSEKWFKVYKLNAKKAGVGTMYLWKHDPKFTNPKRTNSFKFKFRVRNKGGYDFFVERSAGSNWWNWDVTCKIN